MLSIVSLLISILITVLYPGGHEPARMHSPAQRVPMTKARARKSYGALPMSFEVNEGQADSAVSFLARGQGYTILLSPGEAALALQLPGKGARIPGVQPQPTPSTRVLRMRIEGANPSAPATALERLPGVSNYFIGNDPSRWRTNIPTYKQVQFENIRPGVNLVYYGNQSQLEYDFVLSPNIKPQSLGLEFEGSDAIIDSHGDLVFTSTDGSMTFRRPIAYQTDRSTPAKKHFVDASYVLKGRNKVGFEVAHYDPSEPLVIDPSLYYSTFLGGSGGDTGNAIALDALFDAYITGSTSSTNFPKAGSPPPYQGSYGGDTDAFVTKLRYDGEALIYSTYLGGNNFDIGQGIAVDASANVYVTGYTSSANFPTTGSAFQTTYGGNTDAFVSKLDPSGSKLLFSSFLGGSDVDYGLALAIDASGNMFVTGSTQSTDFPTVKPIQAGNAGNGDAFVAEIDTNLPQTQQLVYSTYLGGSSADSGQGIAVDSGDNAYVTGFTFSTNFPVYQAYQSANAGSVDAFISVVSSGGGSLEFSTYLGGTGDDRAYAIALDSQYNIYVAGSSLTTCSPANSTTTYCNPISTFPTSPGAYQLSTTKQSPGYPVVFVTEMNHFGTALLYSTLLGGSLSDVASGIAVDSAGDAYVTGYTESSDFPTANAIQASYVGGTCGSTPCPDAFVTQFNPQGTSVVYSTFLGGSTGNYGNAIAVDTNNNAYIAGTTFSQNFPAIALAYQGQSGNTTGLGSVFVSQISHSNLAAVALTPQKINFGNVTENTTENVTSENVPAVVTVLNAGTAPLQISGVATTGDFAETNNCVGTLGAGGGVCTINVSYTPTVLSQETELLTITDNATGSPHLVTLTGTGVTGVAQVQFSPTSLVFPATILNTTSAAQTVTMTNDGQTPLTVTNISATGDFAETNTCPSYPFTMAVGGQCAFSVTFTPSNTGVRKGSLTITDNVTSGSSSISLTGTGDPNFTLNSPTTSEFVPIGTTTTTFTISLSAPKSLAFTDTIALTCSTGSCSFNPSNIALNSTTIPSSSTLTLLGLSPSSANPFIFTVNGADVTSSDETATLSMAVYFGDFSISATPAVSTIYSGGSTVYSVTVSPVNGFSQPVAISCGKLPQGALCLANPASLTPQNGAAVSSLLTVSTTPQSTSTAPAHLLPRAGPRIPPPPPMMLAVWGACILLMLVILWVRGKRRLAGSGKRRRIIYAQVALAMLALAAAFWISCDTGIYTEVIQPQTVNGTPTGNYTITILGTYTGTTAGIGVVTGTQTTVTRATSVNLVVQ